MRSIRRFLALGLFAVLLAGCGGGSGGGGLDDLAGDDGGLPSTGGMLRIAVTDDPFPIENVLEASVEIGRVEAHMQEGDGWVVLTEETFTINLVGLDNGIVDEIVDIAVDPGTYDQFRFITGPGRVVLDAETAVVRDEDRLEEVTIETPDGPETVDGYVFTVEDGGVKFPSGPQTGIKVHVDPPIVVSSQLTGDLLLEFDLGKNFVFNGPTTHAPGVKRVLFTPSVKASNETVNGSVTVVIMSNEGTPEDASDDLTVENAEVWLVDGGGEKETQTFSDENGVAVLSAAEGAYMLLADKFGFVESTPVSVQIDLANLSDAGVVLLTPSDLVVSGIVYTSVGTGDSGAYATTDTPTGTDDDYPIADVAVALDLAAPAYADSKTTAADGAFTFDRLEEYVYDLTFTMTGFTTLQTTWAPSQGPVSVHLVPLTRPVLATVTDANAALISGATVTATDVGGNTWPGVTDSLGVANFTLPTGTYAFTAAGSGGVNYAGSAPLVVVGAPDDGTSDAITLTPVP